MGFSLQCWIAGAYSLEVQDDVKNPINFIVTFIPFLKENGSGCVEFYLQLCLLGWGKWCRIRLEIEWRKEINMIEDRLSGFYPRFFHDLMRSFPPAHLFPYIVWFPFLHSFRGLMILEDCNCLSDPIWECNVAPRSLQTSWGIEVILVNPSCKQVKTLLKSHTYMLAWR